MKIVIDIPEEKYKRVKDGKWYGNGLADYIENGTPLPKGHGRLIDADALEYLCEFEQCVQHTGIGCNHCQYHTITEYEIDNSPTIIEADKDGD